uniref:small monomeric GTPase n=1 Tax=Trepomonas sp. PC1 TaxID=1076344 RepID=A0A146K284_9EUKA|eukprot:JAP91000.1 Rab-like protein [Trepomonas sp. PC1]
MTTASVYKIVVIGAGAVGKSCITIRFIQGKFVKKYDPTIENFYRKQLDFEGQSQMLDILDTAGQEEFSALRDTYMKQGDGFVIVYAIDNETSFEDTRKLHAQMMRIKEKKCPTILVGNKCDLNESRVIQKQKGEALANELGCIFLESSAKDNINISEIFVNIVKEIQKQNPPKKAKKGCGSN